MRKVKVNILMVEKRTGGFITGIVRRGEFSEKEFQEKKYYDLIKDIPLIDGCEWSFEFIWLCDHIFKLIPTWSQFKKCIKCGEPYE